MEAFGFDWRNAADVVVVEPSAVEPVDPFQGGELEVVEALPRSAVADELGLVEPDDRLGQRVDAVIESFWARMQVEVLNRRRSRTRLELSNAIFECLEIFHNRQRRHSSLGMLTPVEYEIRHATTARDQAS